MKLRKLMAALLVVVMLFSALPVGALAAPAESTAGGTAGDASGQLFLDKKATLEEDGSYTIKMEAYSTGTSTTITEKKGVPLDIVLVLDQSGSMTEQVTVGGKKISKQNLLKDNVSQFIDTVVANGQENNVTHRIGMVGFGSGALEGTANNKDYNWLGTGVFDENGTFVKYQDAATPNVGYLPYDGELAQGSEYYVYIDGQYIKLTYDAAAQRYTLVENPDTNSTNYFGIVNSQYLPAVYGDYVVRTVASNPDHNDGKTYYDENGKALTWTEVPDQITHKYVQVPDGTTLNTKNTYYINDNGTYLPMTYRNGKWNDDTISLGQYTVDGNVFVYSGLLYTKRYPAYTKEPVVVSTKWVLSADGTQAYTGKVYAHETKTGWNVNGTPVTEVYEKNGTGAWIYTQGGSNVLLTNELVYTKQEMSTYAGALVPVTNGANGQGDKRQSLVTATQNIQAEGATRPALGMDMANRIFEQNPLTEADKAANRQRVVIVFTDGVPGYSGYDRSEADRAVAESYISKNTYGAKVYTIGLYSGNPDTNTTDFLSHLSSEYPNANTTYTQVTSPDKTGTQYIVNIDGCYTLAKYEKKARQWKYLKYSDSNGDHWTKVPKTPQEFYEDTNRVPGSRIDAAKQYAVAVTNPEKLAEIFQSISQDITSSTTKVDLNKDSVLCDIMPEKQLGFPMDREFTNGATVDVQIVPGQADDAGNITWDTNITNIPQLKHSGDGATLSENVTVNNVPMTITASTHTKGTDGQPIPHTVEVTGFDYSQMYIAPEHPGAKLVVTIRGLRVLPTAETDKVISTNRPESGLWKQADESGNHPTKPEIAFDQPTTYFPSKTYVLDYAKAMNVPLSDLNLKSVINLDADGFDPFDAKNPTLAITQNYGKAEAQQNQLTYTPTTMQWDGGDTFYTFGETDKAIDGATANKQFGKAWAKVTVIPANNVYYEDTFTSTEGSADGTVGITYTGDWTEIPAAPDANNNTGSAETGTNGDNHGWIPALENENGDTDGSSHHASAENGQTATASFTFTGTGVDVYSRTNGKTGTVKAKLKDESGKILAIQIVDTKSASGEYYQIPTLSFHQGKGNAPLPYGTYTVTIQVTAGAANEGRYEYYLDGIRVYNPAGHSVDDQYEASERNATFVEVRDKLLDANSFSGDSTQKNGPVFIDQLNDPDGNPAASGNTAVVGTYEDLGPKNEVYLKKFQSISFKVDQVPGTHYYVGLKAPAGKPAAASFYGADGNIQMADISHTADMFYEVAPADNGIITISNMSKDDALLSITKLKVTNENGAVTADEVFAPVEVNTLLAAAEDFYSVASETPAEPVEPAPTEPEVTEPAEPDPTEPSTPDVDIDNPEPTDPPKPTHPSLEDILDKIFGGFGKWF